MSYHHLTIEERSCIALYYKQGLKISEIAELIGRNKSTISRELKRNPSRDYGYNAIGAQRKYNKRRKSCKRHKVLENQLIYKLVEFGLLQYWSPDEIVNKLPNELSIGVSTIYRAIDDKMFSIETTSKLRRYGKNLKRNSNKSKGVCYDFSNVKTIHERPKAVETREEFGHWELDTVVLRNECGCHIATFVERKTRYAIFVKIANRKAKTMSDAIIEAFKYLPDFAVKTLTVDRGLEFTDWERVEKALNTKVYFCDPYSPWQRGTNENTNGLLRQFFPRRKLLPPVTNKSILFAQNMINNRPRKVLNYSSPYQLFLLHLT
jgi:IS30 family transposase